MLKQIITASMPIALVAVALMVVAIGSPATAKDSHRIDTHAIDFSDRGDMSALYVEIVSAANKVCDIKGNDSISVRANPAEHKRNCIKYTTQETLDALDSTLLDAVHAGLPSDKRYSKTYLQQALHPSFAHRDF